MKITVKTLQQKKFHYEIDEAEKVLALKQKIEQELKHETSAQKLIYSGKILDDDKQISEYGIKEGDFLVLMVTKKISKKPTNSASTSKTQETSTKPEETPSSAQTKSVSSPQTSSSAPISGENSLVSGEEYKTAVNNLKDMGFPEDQVVKAMRAAFNNPDRAVEYLMSGIPEVSEQAQPENVAPATESEPQPSEQTGESPFEPLRQIPQFDEIRQMILSQPQMLEPMLAQLAQTNPEMLQIIAQNPEGFLRWLAMAGGEGGAPPGTTVIRLTDEENQAIERLTGLGFDRNVAIEAYLACDKNEMLAANYLFDNGNEQFEEQ